MTTYLQQAQTGVWDVRASFLPAIYLEGVNRAGGIAVLLPPQPVDAEVAGRVLEWLDGLVITGGKDVDSASYGQQPHPATDEPGLGPRRLGVRAARRRPAAWHAGARHSRGAQVLNVALGGTLHQHLPDVVGHTRHQQGNAVFNTSAVRTVPGTRLAALIGETSDAQCYHHQAIADLGAGLIVSAQDSDGVIEAVEVPGEPFVLAVQWHPEERLDDLLGCSRRWSKRRPRMRRGRVDA